MMPECGTVAMLFNQAKLCDCVHFLDWKAFVRPATGDRAFRASLCNAGQPPNAWSWWKRAACSHTNGIANIRMHRLGRNRSRMNKHWQFASLFVCCPKRAQHSMYPSGMVPQLASPHTAATAAPMPHRHIYDRCQWITLEQRRVSPWLLAGRAWLQYTTAHTRIYTLYSYLYMKYFHIKMIIMRIYIIYTQCNLL